MCLKDLNNSAHLEELIDAGITSFKIEGRMKDADYVKNVTSFYRQRLDEIINRRSDLAQASRGHCHYTFEVNPEKSFNRGFTDFFINGRQKGIDSPFTPKSMGEYIGEVAWCNPLRMEIDTDKTLHNGDGLCFLNNDNELVGLRADVVNGKTVSCNRPHGAHRGAKIYRNYDLEWQKQVDASTGNRKIDIDLLLKETPDGYELVDKLSTINYQLTTDKIVATNPDKATENIRKKALQWGDTVFNPVHLELQFTEPRLIPASLVGEMKRQLVEKLTDALVEQHQSQRECRDVSRNPSEMETQVVATDPDAIPDHLMTCHHCVRYANGMCSKETGQRATPLFIRNGAHTFRLEFDCRNCQMYVCPTGTNNEQ